MRGKQVFEHNWDQMVAAGIDIARVEISDTFDKGPEYKIRNEDGTFVVFGPEYEGGRLQGWTYASYNDEGGVIAIDGGPAFSDVAERIAKFTH